MIVPEKDNKAAEAKAELAESSIVSTVFIFRDWLDAQCKFKVRSSTNLCINFIGAASDCTYICIAQIPSTQIQTYQLSLT
jgi:hypothetical protein